MASLNRWTGIGRVGRDPQLDYTNSGTARCRLSVATDESYTDRDGTKQEKTTWHAIVLWKQQAEFAGEHARKGSLVYVEGRIQTREYEKDGEKRYATEIVANTLQLLSSAPGGEHEERHETTKRQTPPAKAGGKKQPPPDEEEDELPF